MKVRSLFQAASLVLLFSAALSAATWDAINTVCVKVDDYCILTTTPRKDGAAQKPVTIDAHVTDPSQIVLKVKAYITALSLADAFDFTKIPAVIDTTPIAGPAPVDPERDDFILNLSIYRGMLVASNIKVGLLDPADPSIATQKALIKTKFKTAYLPFMAGINVQ